MNLYGLDIDFAQQVGTKRHRVYASVICALIEGRLHDGDTLVPTRTLAATLKISRGVVAGAYDDLMAAGYVHSVGGSGTIVLEGARQAAIRSQDESLQSAPREQCTLPEVIWDVRPGHPEINLIDARAWRAAWRAGAASALGHNPDGEREHSYLQAALAKHLRSHRGIAVTPDDIFLVPNTSVALTILAQAAGWGGATVVVENPGYQQAWRTLRACGASLRPVEVDDDGLDPHSINSDDKGIYVTPAHQYPLGVRLSVSRRAQLVERAKSVGAYVIEDDYDGEFRYGTPPLPALRSLAGASERVAYLGTASKSLSRDLGIAWFIPPRPLYDAVFRAHARHISSAVAAPSALIFEHFLTSGSYDKHLARASRLYDARRDAVVRALRAQMPNIDIVGVEAGLHFVVRLDVDDEAVCARAAQCGIAMESMSSHSTRSDMRGLVIGYGRLPQSRATDFAAALARVLQEF